MSVCPLRCNIAKPVGSEIHENTPSCLVPMTVPRITMLRLLKKPQMAHMTAPPNGQEDMNGLQVAPIFQRKPADVKRQ